MRRRPWAARRLESMTTVCLIIRWVMLKGMRDRKGGTAEERKQLAVNMARDGAHEAVYEAEP